MITKENEPIIRQRDGNYKIHINGQEYGVCDNNPNELYTIKDVESYLNEHKIMPIPEPAPSEPTEAEKAARKAQEDEAKELALDMAWLRAERKKAKP